MSFALQFEWVGMGPVYLDARFNSRAGAAGSRGIGADSVVDAHILECRRGQPVSCARSRTS